MSAQLEWKVSRLEAENEELKEELSTIKKKIDEIYKSDKHDFMEIWNSIKEFNEKMKSIFDWKENIDKIIEKIKKLLPI